MKLSFDQANAVYGLLMKVGQADPSMQKTFVRYVTVDEGYGFHEWRFEGALGWGGKFKMGHTHVYIVYYPEDETPERDKIALALMQGLKELNLPVYEPLIESWERKVNVR